MEGEERRVVVLEGGIDPGVSYSIIDKVNIDFDPSLKVNRKITH